MKINDIQIQKLEEGPMLNKFGTAVGKGIGTLARGVNRVAGGVAGVGQAVKQGFQAGKQAVAGAAPAATPAAQSAAAAPAATLAAPAAQPAAPRGDDGLENVTDAQLAADLAKKSDDVVLRASERDLGPRLNAIVRAEMRKRLNRPPAAAGMTESLNWSKGWDPSESLLKQIKK